MTWISKQYGFEPQLIEVANKINEEMPLYVINRFQQLFSDGIVRKNILVAGIAYKAAVSDLRESPALRIMSELEDLGANVSWYDPLVSVYKGADSSSLSGTYDGVIVTLPNLKLPIANWISKGVKVFDCTGSHRKSHGVHQL